jgi:hypothetical protein
MPDLGFLSYLPNYSFTQAANLGFRAMAFSDGTKSGGRARGSKNKFTLAKEQVRAKAAQMMNETIPDAFKGDGVDFLQAIYKNPEFDFEVRMEAATRASQFERAKKTESTIEDKTNYVVRMPAPVADLDEWKRLHMNGDAKTNAALGN